MAGLKKPPRKPGNSNPNTVLVVFLVLFVLVSIGLGVWGYYGYAGQEELKKKAKDGNDVGKAANLKADYFAYLCREVRQALGENLDADERNFWDIDRQEFMKEDGGKFKEEKTIAPVKKLVQEVEKDLGFDTNEKKYLKSYKQRVAELTGEIARSRGSLDQAQKRVKAVEDLYNTLNARQDAFHKDAMGRIQAGANAALAASRARSQETEKAIEENVKLRNELKIISDAFDIEKEKLTLAKNQILADFEKFKQEKKDAVVANPRGGADPHALMLDVSKGKPLWDSPLGKITRVETGDRQVVINLGKADGVRPELTFNVFAPGWNGRADKELKGTIEVVRILDNNTSVARITSLYDADGKEIALNDPGKGRLQRESDNPIKEGDLLFNVFWGTRVAIAGNVNWSGFSSESPADQMRNLNQFMQLLQRQGVLVDAYIDLTDGTVKGAVTARTRYLIRGENLYEPRAPGEGAAQPQEKEGGVQPKEKEGGAQPKEKEKEAAEAKPAEEPKAADVKEGAALVGQERIQRVNEAIKGMRNEAVERGMFIISAENYANVVGYRRPQSATSLEVSGFRPSNPSATALPTLILPGGGGEK